MLALISLLAVIVGCVNWLTIGLLQFDFVAGLFGSQSNIFSRIVYVVIGVCAVILTVNIIKNKGRIAFNFKKLKLDEKQPALAPAESGKDFAKDFQHGVKNEAEITSRKDNDNSQKFHHTDTQDYLNESGKDNSKNDLRSLSHQLRDRQNYNHNLRHK